MIKNKISVNEIKKYIEKKKISVIEIKRYLEKKGFSIKKKNTISL